jgi:hypothetical protein
MRPALPRISPSTRSPSKEPPSNSPFAEKLVTVLESLRSAGDHNRSSVLVYEPMPEKAAEQSSVGAPERCEPTNCFIKVAYRPISQLQDTVNKLHSTVHVARAFFYTTSGWRLTDSSVMCAPEFTLIDLLYSGLCRTTVRSFALKCREDTETSASVACGSLIGTELTNGGR